MTTEKKSNAIDPKHLVAGTMAGLLSTVTFYPLELVKTRMQVINITESPYRSLPKAVSSIVSTEGVRGMYRGLTPAVLASSGSWGGYFFIYEQLKERKLQSINSHSSSSTEKLGTADHLLAGVQAGMALVFLFNPLWLVKTRLALQGTVPSARQYTGFVDALTSIAREEGIRGLYKGILPALLLTSHGAVQFASYEKMKVWASALTGRPVDNQYAWVSMIAGGVSKIAASTATYPYQVVKSRLQQGDALVARATQGSSAPERISTQYSGTWDCVVKIWRNEGLPGYFRGLVPGTLKVIPASALTFVVYEECLKLFRV